MALTFQTIDDRRPYVVSKLGNRTDIDASINQWLGDAYLELGNNYPFEELLTTEETSTVVGTGQYNYPDNVRAIRHLSIIDSDDFKTPLVRRNQRFLDRYNTVHEGRPIVYSSYTDRTSAVPPVINRIILVRPVPDEVYTIEWRAWLKPVLASPVENTILYLPDDWLEILDYAASLRGFTSLQAPNRAAEIHALLFGVDNPRTGKREPGLITQRMTAM